MIGEWGTGQFIYCASRLFAEMMHQSLPAIAEFLTGLCLDLYQPTLWVDAPKPVEVTYNRQGEELVVVLVNGVTNRPVRGGVMILRDVPSQDSIDEVIPLGDIRLHVRDQMILGATNRQGDALTVQHSGEENTSSVLLDRLDLYEVIRINIGDASPSPQ